MREAAIFISQTNRLSKLGLHSSVLKTQRNHQTEHYSMKNGAKTTNTYPSILKCGQSPLLSEKTALLTVLCSKDIELREEKLVQLHWSQGPTEIIRVAPEIECDASNSQRLKTVPVRVRTPCELYWKEKRGLPYQCHYKEPRPTQ